MRTPLLSICVITYNHEKFIRKCLEGIFMQKTDFDFEVIIGEDCSQDNTRAIVQEYMNRYPDQIVGILHEKNVGGARNGYEFCYNKIRGKYVAVCEGDDFWTDENKLQKQVDFLEANPDFSFCFHRINAVDETDKITETQAQADTVIKYSPKEIIHTFIPTLSVVFKHNLKSIPREIYKVKSGDTFLFGMLANYGPAADLGFIGASYRKHSGGVFNGLSKIRQLQQAIETRRIMLQTEFFNSELKREIKKEIMLRKKKGLIYLLKQFNIKEIPTVLSL